MILDGRSLADFIKVRHFQQARSFRLAPKLAIINASADPATHSYLTAKITYGQDIGVVVETHSPKANTSNIQELIQTLNQDNSVDGIIVQLPLPKSIDTAAVLDSVAPAKDVDGLGKASKFDPATPTAVLWLLAGYGVEFKDRTVAIIGQGRLVGAPLAKILQDSGAHVRTADVHTKDLAAVTKGASIVVSAVGQPGIIKPDMIDPDTVIIDGGLGSQDGELAGDVDPAVQDVAGVKLTLPRGGLGPMTVAALYENLLRAAGSRNLAETPKNKEHT